MVLNPGIQVCAQVCSGKRSQVVEVAPNTSPLENSQEDEASSIMRRKIKEITTIASNWSL